MFGSGDAAAASRTYTSNGRNQYFSDGGATFSYDMNGNLTNATNVADGSGYFDDYTFTYDVENRLVGQVFLNRGSGDTQTNTTSLRYDPLGRLHEIADSSMGKRWFLYDGSDLVAEYDGSNPGTLLRRYVHGIGAGDDPLVWFEGSGIADSARRYLYGDERGSIVAVTDSSGTVTNVNTYDEYGIPAEGNAGVFQYTGQVWLPELGMYHYKARMYSPTLGRFMQADPIGYGDGMNMYAYVGNDPMNFVDPSGLGQCATVETPHGTSKSCSDGGGFGGLGGGVSPGAGGFGRGMVALGDYSLAPKAVIPEPPEGPLTLDEIREAACRASQTIEGGADWVTDSIGLPAAVVGGVGGLVVAGPGGIMPGATPGLVVAGVSSGVSTFAQLGADISQIHSPNDAAESILRFGVNFAGGRLVSRAIKPFGIGPWLDKAQQEARNRTVERAFRNYGTATSYQFRHRPFRGHRCGLIAGARNRDLDNSALIGGSSASTMPQSDKPCPVPPANRPIGNAVNPAAATHPHRDRSSRAATPPVEARPR